LLDLTTVSFWVEKTYIQGRGAELDASFEFSNSLWSPLTSIEGKGIYRNMKAVKPGDVIIHLAKEKAESSESYTLRGVSVVSKEAEIFDMPPNTRWGDKWREQGLDPKGYIIQLKDYKELEEHLDIDEFLGNPKYSDKMIGILESVSDLFYNIHLKPNQGKYLTKAPSELVLLLNDFCYTKTGNTLPFLDSMSEKKPTTRTYSFKLTEEDFKACKRSEKRNYIKSVKRKFEDSLRPELVNALGESFADFVTERRHPSPYVAKMWTREGGGHYRDHMWLGMAHKKYEDPRHGIQFQFGLNKDSIFSFGIWIEGRGYATRARAEAKERIENKKKVFLDLLRKLGDGYRISASGERKLDEKANEVKEEDFDIWMMLIESDDYYFQIYKDISKEKAIRIGTSIVEEIARTFEELRPIYDLMGGIEEEISEILSLQQIDKVSVTHLLMGRNIVFYGPPGTGKTRKAKKIAEIFCGSNAYSLLTGNSEWTVYDVVGGPTMNDCFKPGFLSLAVKKCKQRLEEEKRPYWLILDELNRANLDLGFGKIFTLLDLDYREKQSIIDDNDVEGLVNKEDWRGLKMPPEFRILATMNSYDRALLFSLGFAFRRRFAFVEVPSPFKESDSQHYELKDEVWDEELSKVEGKFEEAIGNIKREIEKKWISEGEVLSLPNSLKTAIRFSDDLKDKLEKVNQQALKGKFDPHNFYGISVRLADYVTRNGIIAFGYAQPVDLIKFVITYIALFSSENVRKTIVEAMDEAVKAYFIPQMEYFLPKVRREMTIGGEEEESEEKKLEKLIEYLRSLGLTKSANKLENAKKRLKFGEIRIL